VLVTNVLYRKHSGGKDYVVADAGMTELLRPSHYGAYHRILAMRERGNASTVDVVGPVCESGDFLALDRELDDVQPGDCLLVCDVGAYGFAMASNYNSRLRPAEVLVDGDSYAVITAREEYADLSRLGLRKSQLELAIGSPGVAANFVEMRRVASELADVERALAAAEDAWLELEDRAPSGGSVATPRGSSA